MVSYKVGNYIFFISSRIPHFAGFQAFPILQDSINLFEQISCKMGNCYTRLNIAFPILQDFKKIPQFEGFNCSDFYKVGNYIFFISSRIPHFAGFQAFLILQDSINLVWTDFLQNRQLLYQTKHCVPHIKGFQENSSV